MPEKCIFCKLRQDGDFAFETKEFFGRFDRFPVTPGHLEVIPKRHVASFFGLTRAEELDLLTALRRGVTETLQTSDLRTLYRRFVENPINEKSAEFSKAALLELESGKTRDGENIGVNNGIAAGRTVEHLHIHIIPRYVGDVPDPSGGVRHTIPGKGYYK